MDGFTLLGMTIVLIGSISIGLQLATLFKVEDILKHLKTRRTNDGSDDIS